MLRILMLAAFVAFCSTAFVAGNLWAGGENSNTGTKKYKKHEKKSFNNLAKMLKSSKKSSDSSSVGSKKLSSVSKNSNRSSTSKKTLSSKAKQSSKRAHLKSGSHRSTSYGVHLRSPKKDRSAKVQRSANPLSQ
jgi:hypothetical protein